MKDQDDPNKLYINLKFYKGRIPACGVFCGGCPVYCREKNPCPGAEINKKRCENCRSYHLCCQNRGIRHCFECTIFPCTRFKRFAKSWLKYGQNLIENQKLLENLKEKAFLDYYNEKTD